MWKTIMWVIIAVVVIGGGIWWWMASKNGSSVMPGAGMSAETSPVASSSLSQGSSDQAINQEMTSVDAQLNGLSSDSASIDQSAGNQ